jgi:hypothetical protein
MAELIAVGSYVLTETAIPHCGVQLKTAQVVADHGDTFSVVAQGERDAFSVKREGLKTYESVYGTGTPRSGDQPIVSQIRK